MMGFVTNKLVEPARLMHRREALSVGANALRTAEANLSSKTNHSHMDMKQLRTTYTREPDRCMCICMGEKKGEGGF